MGRLKQLRLTILFGVTIFAVLVTLAYVLGLVR